MTTMAIASRFFGEPTTFDAATAAVRSWGLEGMGLDLPGPVPPGSRDAAHGVSFPAVLYRGEARVGAGGGERWAASLALPFDAAARLRAGHVVVEGAGAVAANRTVRERAVEDAARSLHGPLRQGVPLAVRPGSGTGDLLGIEETGWLLDALPRLAFVLDPARARRLHLAEHGPAPEVWAERFGPRTNLIACHGFGDSDAGGRHPAEDDLAWRVLSEMVPGRTPWLLDLAPDLTIGDLEDAIRYVADQLGG